MPTKHSLGFLFEVAFNLGILNYIQQKQISNRYADIYAKDLELLRFSKIKDRIFQQENIADSANRDTVETWCLFILQKGFLSGISFIREYLNSLSIEEEKIEICYLQCKFSGDNSFGMNPDSNYRRVLEQLSDQVISTEHYKKRGEFLNADTLLLIKFKKECRILTVDLSLFSFKTMQDLQGLDNIEQIKKILQKEIKYLKSKSVFANLSIDTGIETFPLNNKLGSYLKAFGREDKESYKLIQAGSYAYSFYNFLRQYNILNESENLIFNIIGYSDRGASAMAINLENLEFLKSAQAIYQQNSSKETVDEARDQLVDTIIRNAKKSFPNSEKFFTDLSSLSPTRSYPIVHQETISDFLAPQDLLDEMIAKNLAMETKISLRQAHANLVHKGLNSDNPYIFLTGNPGIGKTTALVKYLEEHFEEGFIFLYCSPRTQVNLDIINKFTQEDLSSEKRNRVFALTTNSQIISSQNGIPAVRYFSELKDGDFQLANITFLKDHPESSKKKKYRLKQEKEDLIIDYGSKSVGVINSLFQALGILIEKDVSRQIVASLSIQSLKQTGSDKNTLQYFEHIFKSASRKGFGPIPEKMQSISSRYKHFFIMIDEITGDPSGVEFLSEISKLLQRYGLFDGKYGFNSKIIVADASIVENDVISAHLQKGKFEPNKIFYRQAKSDSLPISEEQSKFNNKSAIVINTNAYPASELVINYKIFTQCIKYQEERLKEEKLELDKSVNAEILNEIIRQDNSYQTIVYIQNKNRLQELIKTLKSRLESFEKFEQYIEIHSNNPDNEIEEIKDKKNSVKIIFMTSSASRGLSFPKVKRILVDMPRFSIEQNLMEIIQVIYRGRGKDPQDGLDLEDQAKELTFYISEVIYYDQENPELSLRERILNIIDILLILKAAILTRIKGSCPIGRNHYKIIPVGGKSLSWAGTTYSEQLADFIEQLRKQANIQYSHKKNLQEIASQLTRILNQSDIEIKDISSNSNNKTSYLSVREPFQEKFIKAIDRGFHKLLEFPELELCYITGSLLIVPLGDKKIQEIYQMRLDRNLNSLLERICKIAANPEYPKSLKQSARVVQELLEKLNDKQYRTQYLQQNSQRQDQYYAVPLFIFTAAEVMEVHFSQSKKDDFKNDNFKTILRSYLSTLFPINSVLPIGNDYDKFPFIVFNSHDLGEIRNRLYTKAQLLTSSELNILNLILSQSPDQ